MIFPLFFLLSCQEKTSIEETPQEICESSSHFLAVDEIFEEWTVSMQDIVDEINQFDTCVWENDGSISRFDVHLILQDEHGGAASNDVQYTKREHRSSGECIYSAKFYPYISYFSEDEDLILEDGVLGFLEAKVHIYDGVYSHSYQWFGSTTYQNIDLPPSSPPPEDYLYSINLFAFGEFDQGIIERVELRVLDVQTIIDVAYCHKE